MALLEILRYPDKRLKQPGVPVKDFGAELHRLADDMAVTMYSAPGVGLAATQVGIPLRMFVLDLTGGERGSEPRVFANPEIVETHGTVLWEEGCLSFPGIHEDVRRAEWVRVRAQDRNGEPFEEEGDGLFAVAVQHEIDHLDGILVIDRVSFLRRRLIHRAMLKRGKESHPGPAEAGAL